MPGGDRADGIDLGQAQQAPSAAPPRKVIHVDMDAFYASVEQRDHPEWRGRPLIVGGSPDGRGVVAAASYEARRFGVRSAMPAGRALRLCPQAIVVRPDFERYRAISREIRAIFERYTEHIEPLSIDEAYLDVTENKVDEPYATRVARAIKSAIRSELDLAASAGVGPNKLVAKIASDADKPDGLCVVPPERVVDFLAPLPVRAIPGIGPRAGERCQEHGLERIADLRHARAETLSAIFGSAAEHIRDLAWGRDERPVRSRRERKSVGIEDTFARDLAGRAACCAQLVRLAESLARRLATHACRGRTLTLKVRYADFTDASRAITLSTAIGGAAEIARHAEQLLDDTDAAHRPVRLLGITLSNLDESGAVQERLDFAGWDPSDTQEQEQERTR